MGICIQPYRKEHEGKIMDLPCGKCYECKIKRSGGWSFRLQKELQRANTAHFITLTYDNPPMTQNGFPTLDKRDLQLFFKRLRKQQFKKIKYYAVGEYGTKTMRPHYHIIFYNVNIENIQKAWQNGHTHIGEVNEKTVAYTLKYISKDGKIPLHSRDDRQKEFSLMSKRLGDNYLTPQMAKYHQADPLNRFYIRTREGHKVSIPRYYKDKLFTLEQREEVGKAMQIKALQEINSIDLSTHLKKMEDLRKIRINKTRQHKIKSHGTTI